MDKKKIKEIRTLVIRLSVLIAIIIGIVLIVKFVKAANSSGETPIDDTPLRVEQIKAILELNTVRFKDEVVVDTMEMLKNGSDLWEKLTNFSSFDEIIKPSAIKRRLTVIVKGELLYGVDLKTSDFDVTDQKDTLFIKLPEPKLLSATVNPLNIEIFVETGTWSDGARRKLVIKAKKEMIQNGEDLHLPLKAREPLERTIRQLVKTDKPVKIIFVK